MKRELERVEIPDEHGARERAWAVLSSAFAKRTPASRRSLHWRPALALAVVLALVAAAFSSPGKGVVDRIRKTVGIEHAAPALFSLPSPGKLLVRTDAGVWVVQRNGSRRFLGGYREASWSPFGRRHCCSGRIAWPAANLPLNRPRASGVRIMMPAFCSIASGSSSSSAVGLSRSYSICKKSAPCFSAHTPEA